MMPLVAYILLFLTISSGFIFLNLLIGKLIRPNRPNIEKKTIYECGEETIGSSFVQFDMRFYVVALLFVLFDVEIAMFFPWAEVFGKITNLVAIDKPATMEQSVRITEKMAEILPEPVKKESEWLSAGEWDKTRSDLQMVSLAVLTEAGIFIVILLAGFAYLWREGDLEWIRSTLAENPLNAKSENTNSTLLLQVSNSAGQLGG